MEELAALPAAGIASYERVTRMDFPTVVRELKEQLGAKLVTYIAGVGEARAVRQWSSGEREPRQDIPARLRIALRAALVLSESEGPGVAQAWFQGLNP